MLQATFAAALHPFPPYRPSWIFCWGLANLISDTAACGEPLGLFRLDASD